MKLTTIGLLGALALSLPGAAQAFCKVKLPDGSWYYGDKCAQVSRKGLPDDAVDQSAPAVMKDLNDSRERDRGLDRRRLRGYDYERSGVYVRPVETNDDYSRR